MTAPKARGLFHKAIAQSTNMRAVPVLHRPAFGMQSAEEIGAAFAAQRGATDLAGLRALDAGRLAGAPFTAQPTVDGRVVPEQVVETFDGGRQARVPLLTGFNSGEIRGQRIFLPPAPANAAAYEAEINRRYGDLAPAFLRLYPSSDIPNAMLATLRDAICDAATRARDLCAFHASELPYIFGLERTPPNWPRPDGAAERALSEAMLDYWVSFAATGVPRSAGGPAWRSYGRDEHYMRFAGTPLAERDPVPGMFELQEEVVARRRRAGRNWLLDMGVAAPVLPDR
jgi:para-nitrobenzyl esterase